MRRMLIAAALFVSACGGSSGNPGSPSAQPQPPPQRQNRAPSVTATATPNWGMTDLTQFTFQSVGTDPDGDPLTYRWAFSDGYSGNTQNVQRIYLKGGEFSATVTATDSHNASATATVSLVVASMTGTWRGQWSAYIFTMNLTQSGGTVTGTYTDQDGTGKTDPAEPGKVDANGRFTLRIKQGDFGDWYFQGQIDKTGRRASGTVKAQGTGPFTMDKI